jgi:hypothetical protein
MDRSSQGLSIDRCSQGFLSLTRAMSSTIDFVLFAYCLLLVACALRLAACGLRNGLLLSMYCRQVR